jgi:hypothetical protein
MLLITTLVTVEQRLVELLGAYNQKFNVMREVRTLERAWEEDQGELGGLRFESCPNRAIGSGTHFLDVQEG